LKKAIYRKRSHQ